MEKNGFYMKTNAIKLNTWVSELAKTKPYRLSMKNGQGFYELIFLYNEYHYSDRIFPKDLENELECQKKILNMCSVFEKNMKPRVF